MEAHEKLYFFNNEPVLEERSVKRQDANIEYVRTDAFIEKALKFIKTNIDRIVNNQHGVCMGCMDVEFKNYMKGE